MQSKPRHALPIAALVIAMILMIGVTAGVAAAHSERGYPRLMQGPMLGSGSPTSIRIWMRGSGDFRYAVQYATSRDFENASVTPEQTAQKRHDYTLVFEIDGLEPGTRYFYRLLAEGRVSKYQRDRLPASFETPPEEHGRFRVATGSCARAQASGLQPIWDVVSRLEPDLFFWTGDNIYGDALDPDILAEEYRRQREVRSIIPVLAHVPQLATWDDHDYGLNNHDRTSPGKRDALRVFKRYWPNPSYGLPDTAGIFFSYGYRGVDFFFIDNRYHRDPNKAPNGPGKTMLGDAQFEWLVDGLERSEAVFKVIVSGSGFNSAKGPTGDAWSAFLHERDRLFNEIAERGINGVVLFSGDTHAAELNRIESPHPLGYPFYEIASSPLAQEPTSSRPPLSGREARLRDYYNRAANAGVIDFDTSGDDPSIRANVVNQYGEYVWDTLEIRASDLRVGK